ncbi:ribonuclease P protein subunit p25b [Osmerus eperlanus]|uniref:ribonuclease P protein subunit p25b n=1 Tax=Osmerus eperlanus TaxID=29151 RepID=UPI002E1444E6
MFTGCGVAGFQTQYQIPAPVGPHTALEVNRQVQVEVGVTPQMYPPFQGQAYCGHLPSTSPSTTLNSISTSSQTSLPIPPPPAALKLGQGGFKKMCRTEEDGPCPFPGLPAGVLEMRVKEGSKIRNLMGFAMSRMQGERGEVPGGAAMGVSARGGGVGGGLRQVVFTGSGRAVTKTITCAEIMKRKVGGLHQMTKLRYKGVREVWESQEGGASEMTVHRTVPSISILLSKDPLDPQEPGYQPPETLSALWEERDGAGEGGAGEGAPQAASKRTLGVSPRSSHPDCKRVCLGEGGGVGGGSGLTPR